MVLSWSGRQHFNFIRIMQLKLDNVHQCYDSFFSLVKSIQEQQWKNKNICVKRKFVLVVMFLAVAQLFFFPTLRCQRLFVIACEVRAKGRKTMTVSNILYSFDSQLKYRCRCRWDKMYFSQCTKYALFTQLSDTKGVYLAYLKMKKKCLFFDSISIEIVDCCGCSTVVVAFIAAAATAVTRLEDYYDFHPTVRWHFSFNAFKNTGRNLRPTKSERRRMKEKTTSCAMWMDMKQTRSI